MKSRQLLLALFLIILCFSGCSSSDDDSLLLEDGAQLLAAAEAEHLRALHDAMLGDFDVHFKLVTIAAPAADINSLAAELFQDLGAQTRGAKGLLFLVDPQGHQVRIEVGYDLEGHFPDAFINYLETRQMVPFFQAGQVARGIEATSELLITRLQNAIAGKAYDPQAEGTALPHYSGGAGAKVKIRIGIDEVEKTAAATSGIYRPQDTPEKTLAVYRQVLYAHIKDPNLEIYTPQTRKFFAQWVVTDAQQDNELRSLNQSKPEKTIISGALAVMRFPQSQRTQPPYFFRHEGNGWLLDFSTMSHVLQMNHQNMWHFRNLEHDYMFGFSDWQFDANGFPSIPQQPSGLKSNGVSR